MWESNGIRGFAEKPRTAGQFSGTLLVCGSGRSLWSDLERAPAGDLMLVNDAAWLVDQPAVHFATLHPELLPYWVGYRNRKWRYRHLHTHSAHASPEVENVWHLESGVSFSGVFGAVAGLALGYERVILCGVPQTGDGYVWSRPGAQSEHQERGIMIEVEWWRDNCFRGRVRSMSGRTRDWLGEPDGL